jgi:hypothetical protein
VAAANKSRPQGRKRKPVAAERQAATRLAVQLRQVTYPGRAKTKVMQQMPPGRVKVREAARGVAQRQARAPITATPFSTTVRAKTVHTQIRVGIMCDISGSMRVAEEPLAVARWVLADALHQINGEVATVLFGSSAHGVQAPRERLTDIEAFNHDGASEDYVGGFSMIDGALNLIDGDGARLLVIITDGHFVRGDAVEYAEVTMDMCKRAGVAVVWMDMGGYFARDDGYGHGTVISAHGMSPIEVADLLGKAVVDEFRRSAQQHSLHTAA